MKILGRKHKSVDEVIKQLEKKGCLITTDQAITKRVTDYKLPSETFIKDKYEKYLKGVNRKELEKDTYLLGIDAANEKYFSEFKEKNSDLFRATPVQRTIVIQAEYTINLESATNIGNKSWGKIDFLVNHNGFIVINQKFMRQ